MTESETMNLEDSAKLVGVGLEAWRDIVDSGQVPAVRLNQKHTVLLREDVIDFIRVMARKQAEERRRVKAQRPGRRTRTPVADLDKYA